MIKFFKELSKSSVAIAGGKGASLGEMTRFGMQVPPGFVITAKTFDDFLKLSDLSAEISSLVKKVNYKDLSHVEDTSETIRDLIHDAVIPSEIAKEILSGFSRLRARFVAVRSSATAEDSSQASWAGELETYLNTTRGKLLENVKKCWSSLYTPRAIVYRNEKGLIKSDISVAVVIQKMVPSSIAGVCFTVHPVTEDRNQMIIEAVWGLGEALVGGSITPDLYVIDKRDWSLIDVNVEKQVKRIGGTVAKAKQSKQKLSSRQIIKLAKVCGKIEKHYKFPCDIEWCFKDGKFYIVQSRPITTL